MQAPPLPYNSSSLPRCTHGNRETLMVEIRHDIPVRLVSYCLCFS